MTKRFLLSMLEFYRCWLSPLLHTISPLGCRYRPTCSEYAIEAISMHGVTRGGGMALKRFLRCRPFAPSGFDPVPAPFEPHPAVVPDPLP